jgi:hypothetical protein
MMLPMPLHNYEDFPRTRIEAWCDYFKQLPKEEKTALFHMIWESLTNAEQTAVIADLRYFMEQAKRFQEQDEPAVKLCDYQDEDEPASKMT